MDQMDQLHNEHMNKLTTNMEQLISSIASDFLYYKVCYTRHHNTYTNRQGMQILIHPGKVECLIVLVISLTIIMVLQLSQ